MPSRFRNVFTQLSQGGGVIDTMTLAVYWHPAQVLCELPALLTAQGAAAWGQLLQATLKALEQRSEQESPQDAPPEALEDIAEESQG